MRQQTALRRIPSKNCLSSFPPFHYQDQEGKLTGLFYDIITEAVEHRLGIPLVWTPYPWPRCQENVKNGREDAIMTTPTAARAAYSQTHHQPFYTKALHLFTSADHPRMAEIMAIRKVSDINGKDLSVITYRGNGWHKKNVSSLGVRTIESNSIENIWQMLILRRGDLVIEWPEAANPDIQKLGLTTKIIDTGIVLAAMDFHLLIRSDSPHVSLLENFDRTINSMREDGTIDSILSRYH